MKNPRQVTLEYLPLSDLRQRKRSDNPKLHDEDAIAASFGRAGYVTPIVLNERDGALLAGHGRVDALATLQANNQAPPDGVRLGEDGSWQVPVVRGVDLAPGDAEAFLLADNRTVELGGWDEKRLGQLLVDLSESEPGLSGSGFSSEEMDRLLTSLLSGIDGQQADPDDAPQPVESAPSVSAGHVYQLAAHRLVCGDARDSAVVSTAVGEAKAHCLLTDPPYGVNYEGSKGKRIQNDDDAGLPQLLESAFATADAALAPGSPIYVFHPAGPLSLTFGAAVVAAGWQFRQSLVWSKGTPVLGRSDYHYAHEPILYAAKPASRGKVPWHGGRDQRSVLEFPRPQRSADHPTMKPVALLEALLKNSTTRGETVLDPFLGSGSTLIAAERLGRRCVGIELDPVYAEVAIRRWERFTGRSAELISSGGH